jgi:hypothetical protein
MTITLVCLETLSGRVNLDMLLPMSQGSLLVFMSPEKETLHYYQRNLNDLIHLVFLGMSLSSCSDLSKQTCLFMVDHNRRRSTDYPDLCCLTGLSLL